MPRVSNSVKDYGVLEVKCKGKLFRERLPTRCVRIFFLKNNYLFYFELY